MYVPHSDIDIKKIFKELNINSLDELFTHIPKELLLDNGIDVNESISELEAIDYFETISKKNKTDLVCFAGGGHYDVFLPHTVKTLTMRPEFMTSYTPYQPEISQGVLQALFEFQSLVCDLTEMELANASLYDGATSIAEAISVAINKTKRDSLVISNDLNPNSKEVIDTLINSEKFTKKYIDLQDGRFPDDYIFTEDDAAFVVSYPHFNGSAQDLSNLVSKAKENGVVTICYVDPTLLGILKTPGNMGFDIVVAEGQSIGTPLSYGGPTVGWFATKKEFARLVPGRIIGESRDSNNLKTYVMTLRAREQDIRREKASSNICTNQTLNAIASAIHLCWLGPEGIYTMGYQAMQKARYMKDLFIKNKVDVINNDLSIREFLIKTNKEPDILIDLMADRGFLAGIKYDDNHLLIAVTEKRTKQEIDQYIKNYIKVSND